MKYKINKNSPTPLYYQIEKLLKNKINNGEYKDGDFIPSENELAGELGVSKLTVRKALKKLVNAGYVSRHRGKGTFVTGTKINQGFIGNLEGYSEEMERRKIELKSQVLAKEKINAEKKIASMLNLNIGEKIIKLKRLRFIEGDPIIITTSYLPFNKVPDLLEYNFGAKSLYTFLKEKYNYLITRGVRSFEPRLADNYQAELLNMKQGDPIQYIESITYLENDEPIEYIEAVIKGNRSRFTVKLVRNSTVGTNQNVFFDDKH